MLTRNLLSSRHVGLGVDDIFSDAYVTASGWLVAERNFAASSAAFGDAANSAVCGCYSCMVSSRLALSKPDAKSDAIVPDAQVLPSSGGSGGGSGPQFLGDAIGDTIGTASTLAINSSISSLIDNNSDVDVFRVSLVAGQTYTFSLEKSLWTSALDPFLELRNGAGTIIDSDDDGGIFINAQLTYTATSTGDFYLFARGFSGVSNGPYAITANQIAIGNTSPTTLPSNGLPMYSWDQAAIQLNRGFQEVDGSNWPGDQASWSPRYGQPVTVTYAYRLNAPGTMPDGVGGFTQFSLAQIAATEAALAAWASVANIVFQRVNPGGYSDSAAMLFGNYSTGAAGASAFAFLPISGATDPGSFQGDVWVNSTQSDNLDFSIGGWGLHVLMHEIGHAIGLSHPGDYNAGEGQSIEYGTHAEYYNDTRMFTVMSYFGSTNTGGDLGGFASQPQLHDIAAIQRLYGANFATRSGDTIYGFNSNTGLEEYAIGASDEGAVFSIWDGGGLDTLDLSGYMTNSVIDLREESFSSAGPGGTGRADFNISIARGVVIENATGGSGNDTITGNSTDNILDGGAGADQMDGGDGDDTYVVENDFDVTWEGSTTGGNDTVIAHISRVLVANVENLTLAGVAAHGGGNALNNVIIGNAQNNLLWGLAGNDTLDGGAGADQMDGGDGDDTYVVENDFDVTWEGSTTGGNDTVIAHISRVLVANVENLTLAGVAAHGGGNALNNVIIGNAQNNLLWGLAGNDTLDGGAGADQMDGGDGDDTYVVENDFDVTWEGSTTGGNDTVIAHISRVLVANVENLTLAGVAAHGGGNALNNVIIGNAQNNLLWGLAGNDTLDGGAGADQMDGGDGDDTYVVENDFDVTWEGSTTGGNDTVIAHISRVLVANVENLTLAGVAAHGGGNALNNVIIGNAQNNLLWGLAGNDTLDGGAGADQMDGGDGDDTYVVENDFDVTWEGSTTGGNDTVIAHISRVLVANVENLTLAGVAAHGGGNALNNVIIGNAQNNLLWGLAGNDTLDGGAGADQMDGGDGDDTYVVENDFDVTWEGSTTGGNDTVIAHISRVLVANVENLTLAGAATNGTGNALDNVITGNGVANTLTGGAGADDFVFNTALGPSNVDTITDFSAAEDAIFLNRTIFTQISAGQLAAGAFAIGSAAADASDRIIYNSATGALYYDPDGNGGDAAVQFATLASGLALENDNFFGG